MHEIVFHLGLIFLGAWSLMKFIRKLGFPSVTAYILFGILIGPGVLDIVNKQILSASPLVATIALSFIAFSIGQNFVISELKTYGKMVLLISVWEAFLAWILVALVMHFFLGMDFPYAFCLGAVACATAPAATMLIIREYRASGLYTKTLLGVVALDDAWCLIIISISISIAKALIFSQNSHNAVIFFHSTDFFTKQPQCRNFFSCNCWFHRQNRNCFCDCRYHNLSPQKIFCLCCGERKPSSLCSGISFSWCRNFRNVSYSPSAYLHAHGGNSR